MDDRPELQLRHAEPSDAEAIAGINHRGWLAAYRGLVPDAVLDTLDLDDNVRRWTAMLSEAQNSGYQNIVAVDDGVIGHLTVGPSRNQDGVGEVVALYVEPDRKGRGIGSELLRTGHRILRNAGFDRATLWTLEGNKPTIGFYRKHGWELDGSTKVEGEGDRAIHEVRLSIDLDTPASHIDANRSHWDDQAAGYAVAGERAWAGEPSWGIFGLPETEVGAFPDVDGLDVVELGCGTAYVSAWCVRAGAKSVIGLDNSPQQLATAKRLQAAHDMSFPLVWGDAERLPLADESVDVAISEYGAAIWCDPHRWIAEASRVLRPGGSLTFLGNSLLAVLTANDFEGIPSTNELRRPQRELHHLRWPDTDASEFHVSHGDMIRILRSNDFEVVDLIELYAPEGASTDYTFLDAAWAAQWPHEEVWVARRM